MEHRWTIPCELHPDEAEQVLLPVLEVLEDEGWSLITHIETVGFFGWTVRSPDGRAAGVSVPQPTGPDTLMVRSEHRQVGDLVVQRLTEEGPLEGREARHATGPDP